MQLLLKQTYLAMISDSLGTHAYRHFYALDEQQQEVDLLRDGGLSCANFVSSLLYRFQLIKEPHLTISGTIRDLEQSGWLETAHPQAGDLVVWVPIEEFGKQHRHLGFWMSETRAISNSTNQGMPVEHHLTFGTNEDGSPVRRVEKFYTHPLLQK